MPNRLRKRPGADADLDSIWSYIASDNLDAAERLMARIRAAFALLVQNPRAGRDRSEFAPGLRVSWLPTTLYSISR
jgi:toxin ParE1/3/4